MTRKESQSPNKKKGLDVKTSSTKESLDFAYTGGVSEAFRLAQGFPSKLDNKKAQMSWINELV